MLLERSPPAAVTSLAPGSSPPLFLSDDDPEESTMSPGAGGASSSRPACMRSGVMWRNVLAIVALGIAALDWLILDTGAVWRWSVLIGVLIVLDTVLDMLAQLITAIVRSYRSKHTVPSTVYHFIRAVLVSAPLLLTGLVGLIAWPHLLTEDDSTVRADAIFTCIIVFSVCSVLRDVGQRVAVQKISSSSFESKVYQLAIKSYVVFRLMHHGCRARGEHCVSRLEQLLALPRSIAVRSLIPYFSQSMYTEDDHPLSHFNEDAGGEVTMQEQIWFGFGNPEFITQKHIEAAVHQSPKLTRQALEMFDLSGSGQVTPREATIALKAWSRERVALGRSLVDFDSSVIYVVTQFFASFFWAIMALVIPSIFFNQRIDNILLTGSALWVGIGLAFGNVMRDWTKAVMFIVMTQPYAVGDLIQLNGDDTAVAVTVVSISTTYTVFRTAERRHKRVPNHLLADMALNNLSRSGPATIIMTFAVNIDTPTEALDELTSRIRDFLADNALLWEPNMRMTVAPPSNNLYWLTVRISCMHRLSWSESSVWFSRTRLVHHVRQALQELGISWKQPEQPISVRMLKDDSPSSS